MFYMIICIVILIIVGLLKNVYILKTIKQDYDFICEYHKRFSCFLESITSRKKFNNEQYNWLMQNLDRIQSILGPIGLISYTQFNVIYNDVPIILNFFNNVLSIINDPLSNYDSFKFIEWCQTAFLRKEGILSHKIENIKKELFNPIYNLVSAIRFILEIPINFLYSVGLLSNANKNKIVEASFFKFVSGIITVLTLLSLIFSIVIDFPSFLDTLKDFFGIK